MSRPPSSIATVPRKKTARRKWPARKLAQSRTESVIGRITIVVMNSIGTSSTYRTAGAPGGNSTSFMYPMNPCFAMPTVLYVTHATIARMSGNAIRLFEEKFSPGTTSKMFQNRIAKKAETSNGMKRSVADPSIGSPMFSRTNCTPSSAIACIFPGTSDGRRRPK